MRCIGAVGGVSLGGDIQIQYVSTSRTYIPKALAIPTHPKNEMSAIVSLSKTMNLLPAFSCLSS